MKPRIVVLDGFTTNPGDISWDALYEQGDVVIYESTVYPGVTEDMCGAILAEVSGLKQSVDFKLGYSPERINPGDKSHTLEKIIKVVAGQDPESLETISRIYNSIIDKKEIKQIPDNISKLFEVK